MKNKISLIVISLVLLFMAGCSSSGGSVSLYLDDIEINLEEAITFDVDESSNYPYIYLIKASATGTPTDRFYGSSIPGQMKEIITNSGEICFVKEYKSDYMNALPRLKKIDTIIQVNCASDSVSNFRILVYDMLERDYADLQEVNLEVKQKPSDELLALFNSYSN